MINNKEDAIKAVREFGDQVRQMDQVLCRKGGHPDESWWITDQPLHERLVRMMSDLDNMITWLERK